MGLEFVNFSESRKQSKDTLVLGSSSDGGLHSISTGGGHEASHDLFKVLFKLLFFALELEGKPVGVERDRRREQNLENTHFEAIFADLVFHRSTGGVERVCQ